MRILQVYSTPTSASGKETVNSVSCSPGPKNMGSISKISSALASTVTGTVMASTYLVLRTLYVTSGVSDGSSSTSVADVWVGKYTP